MEQALSNKEAISKALKLLKLAKSSNPHEAAVAAAKAQEIIDRYQLTALDPEQDHEHIGDWSWAIPAEGSRTRRWRVELVIAVAGVNGCRVYMTGDAFGLIGRESDVEATKALCSWLFKEHERLVKEEQASARRIGLIRGKAWWEGFKLGISETINRRLWQQKRETENAVLREAREKEAQLRRDASGYERGENPLVLVQNNIEKRRERLAEVIRWEKANMKYGSRYSSRAGENSAYGRERGREVGNQARLSQAKGLTVQQRIGE